MMAALFLLKSIFEVKVFRNLVAGNVPRSRSDLAKCHHVNILTGICSKPCSPLVMNRETFCSSGSALQGRCGTVIQEPCLPLVMNVQTRCRSCSALWGDCGTLIQEPCLLLVMSGMDRGVRQLREVWAAWVHHCFSPLVRIQRFYN